MLCRRRPRCRTAPCRRGARAVPTEIRPGPSTARPRPPSAGRRPPDVNDGSPNAVQRPVLPLLMTRSGRQVATRGPTQAR